MICIACLLYCIFSKMHTVSFPQTLFSNAQYTIPLVSEPGSPTKEEFKEDVVLVVDKSSPSAHDTADLSESGLVLDWEVLEAEDTSVEKEEGSSGLVKTIVDVFHKG